MRLVASVWMLMMASGCRDLGGAILRDAVVGTIVGPGQAPDPLPPPDTVPNQLTAAARSYAIDGDCRSVETIGIRVWKMDAAYYAAYFAHDETIVQHCPARSR